MNLAFTLSMPGVNSWNGKWSGEDKLYVIVRNLGNSKKSQLKAEDLSKVGYFGYDFGDGWHAGVEVKVVDAAEARALKRKSAGFCGYDWMVDSILLNGKIQVAGRS